ncbi:aspartate aminotransferase family protein [Natronogracilivirga saccharolytica]|uniref:Aspartate aminotransferase family protein n=1 Tax=Natronogracilivirga saccharolytica TaxID=2812953 RepID=A0A8J7UXS0_9BACT|nr:aspartate aminotransferase family protein [Natronogracilivirga saccharolytica]MBP3193644.1 aspartate aminotransferase family protein [Natronogracilivirga saccharolytica]
MADHSPDAHSPQKNAFQRHIAQTSDAPLGLEIERAEGVYLHTRDGREIIDFISGIAVSSLGHGHPEVVRAVQEQAARHMHVMVYGEFVQDTQSALAARLTSLLPGSLDRVYFVNSGTEANEAALKLAKKATGRHRFLAFRDGYHGDTQGSLSVTGRDVYRKPYEPLLPDVHFFDFNLHSVLESVTEDVAAVILEPIQGEGGIIPSDPDWLQALRKRCSETGTLLIFDEIQSGFGRTGKLFAFEHYGVVPDILTMAKAMGGGMPLGGLAASSRLFEAFMYDPPLNHVTTFGGHPVSCAAADAALRVLVRDGWMERAHRIEEAAKGILQGPGIDAVRGKGAMLGLQLTDSGLTRKTVQTCMERHGILLGWTLHSNTLIRLAPPLIIDEALLAETLTTIRDTVAACAD